MSKMIELNPSTEEQAKLMPGMQRGKAKLLMMPMVMLKMFEMNPSTEEQAKMMPGMQRGKAKLLMMPVVMPIVVLL